MQSKRDYLVSLGLAKPGRGKFSNAAKKVLAKAEAEGMKFADMTPPKKPRPEISTGKTETGNPVRETSPGESPYIFPSDFRFPEAEYKAVGADGKTYSMRECCNTCRVSLTNHVCETPTIHGNMTVNIRRVA